MRYSKPHLPFSAQIQLLHQRGLIIGDPVEAERFLEQNNYYRVSAYFRPFYAAADCFRAGTTLQDVAHLYACDANLRSWLHGQLAGWEIYFKTQAAYWHSQAHGFDGYKDAQSFHAGFWERHPQWLQKSLTDFRKSKELFSAHFKTRYPGSPYPPLWMLCETMTFGAIAQWVDGLETAVLQKLAEPFGISKDVLLSWVHTMVYIRNLCAHHGRTWNRELSIRPMVPRDWEGREYQSNRIFRVLSMLEYMNLKVHGASLAPLVRGVLEQFPVDRWPSMGVPQNWIGLWGTFPPRSSRAISPAHSRLPLVAGSVGASAATPSQARSV